MSQKTYLDLDYRSGRLFQFSATQQPEFEKHVSKTGKESFRKYFQKVEGKLDSVSIRDSDFGKKISIALWGGTYINFGISDAKGNVDQYAEAVIKVLPFLNRNDEITINPYHFTPENEKYAKVGVSFSVGGEKVKGLTNAYYKDGKVVVGDIPPVLWKDSPLGGKKPSAASLEEKNDYLLGVLTKETERLKWVGSGTPEPTPPQNNDYEEDTLPF